MMAICAKEFFESVLVHLLPQLKGRPIVSVDIHCEIGELPRVTVMEYVDADCQCVIGKSYRLEADE